MNPTSLHRWYLGFVVGRWRHVFWLAPDSQRDQHAPATVPLAYLLECLFPRGRRVNK